MPQFSLFLRCLRVAGQEPGTGLMRTLGENREGELHEQAGISKVAVDDVSGGLLLCCLRRRAG